MVWCEYQIWKALWKNLIHEFQKDSLIPNICSPLNLEETVCILHSAVLEGFVSVVHWQNFFCKLYQQAPRIQLHFPS